MKIGGRMSPILLIIMINKESIQELANQFLEGKEMFLVDLSVSVGNKIAVVIDSFEGIRIEECIALSRHIEGNLDREIEDFELQVLSAGIDQPFKLIKQYEKHLGQAVQIITTEGQVLKGKLLNCSQENFQIEHTSKKKIEGKKKKELVTELLSFDYTEIKSTKLEITFK